MAEKSLFIDIFLRLGLEPYIFVLIQKLARLHPKVLWGLQTIQSSTGAPPPSPHLHEGRVDLRSSRHPGRAAARSGLCRRHRAKASVGLETVHRDDLLPLARLDG
jgi:hypothetical protein